MDRRKRTIVAGVHRLQHVKRLRTTNLTDYDAIRPHTQAIADQVTLSHLTVTFDIRWPGLETHNMRLAQLQLGGVLDCDDSFVLGYETGKDIQHRRFTGTGTARYQDVQLCLHDRAQNFGNFGSERTELDQVFHLQQIHAKPANGHHRPIE